MKNIYFAILIAAVLVVANSCQQAGGDKPGSEYMPDMAHSIAYESNTYAYYYNNTWGSKDEYYEMAQPRKPVKGTIPRGQAGQASDIAYNNTISVPENGAVPYYYEDTEEDRARATAEIIKNPYKITDEGLARAKDLYNIYCGICHGEKGDGAGYIVRDPNPATGDIGGKYPVQPANFLLDEFLSASNGRYYHAIHYGKNLMGNYRDKLSWEERWQVIHYIRSLQAKELKLTYNQMENTLNAIDEPAGEMAMETEEHMDEGAHSDDHGSEEDHGDDHSNDEH